MIARIIKYEKYDFILIYKRIFFFVLSKIRKGLQPTVGWRSWWAFLLATRLSFTLLVLLEKLDCE